jgi:hypothetical protein
MMAYVMLNIVAMQSIYAPLTCRSWIVPEEETQYLNNRRDHADLLRQHGWWHHEPFEYSMNEHGFRSDPFNTSAPGVLFLGCSHTMGWALPEANTWARRVSDELGIACWNLAQGGGSMDTCFRLAEHWIPRLRPTQVMMLCPAAERLELLDAQGSPGFYTSQDHATPMVAAWLKHPDNCRLNYSKNLRAIQQICNEHTTPLHSWPVDELYNVKEATGLARDLQHVGAEYHLKFAERVLREIDAHGVD